MLDNKCSEFIDALALKSPTPGGVGAAFCEAALRGAKLNVLINTSQMKNETLKNDIENEIMDIEKEFVNKSKIIFSYVENVITRRYGLTMVEMRKSAEM